uniref:Bestrophin homolog n=1 Tax=Schistocephalus solidus TaxID=70667 RepID=A0A0V0J4F4_SCHSO
MTVSYSSSVATASHSALFRLLGRWKGSIYKLIWADLLIFCIFYATIALAYHLIPITSPELLELHRKISNFHAYVSLNSNYIPLSFILGFFVTLVVKRWRDQFNFLPTPDGVSLLVCSFVQSPKNVQFREDQSALNDEVATIRQTVTRYINLASVLCFQNIAPNVKEIYQSATSFVSSGFMTERELEFFGQVDPRFSPFYIPLMWSITVLKQAHANGFIAHEHYLIALIDEIRKFRRRLFALTNYERVPIPLVYTQVVNIGVYAFVIVSLISGQFAKVLPEIPVNLTVNMSAPQLQLNSSEATEPPVPILYVPIFSLLQVAVYLGWLKVAQSLLNPFGDDDEDFDLIPLMDRNLTISLWMVDLQHAMPRPQVATEITRARRISLKYAVDNLLFHQYATEGDPLLELLTSSKDLRVPETLNPHSAEDAHGGGTARSFERRESKVMEDMLNLERRASRSVVALVNRLRPRVRPESTACTPVSHPPHSCSRRESLDNEI